MHGIAARGGYRLKARLSSVIDAQPKRDRAAPEVSTAAAGVRSQSASMKLAPVARAAAIERLSDWGSVGEKIIPAITDRWMKCGVQDS